MEVEQVTQYSEEYVFQAIEDGREHPRDYFGDITDYQDQGWTLFVGRHRDSDNLENSNFETIEKQFEEKYEKNEDFRIEGSSHWAVGWTDQMMIRALQCQCDDWEKAHIVSTTVTNEWFCQICEHRCEVRPIVFDALDIKERLDEYPVLDEEDFSRRDYEDLMNYVEDEVSSFIRRNGGDTIEEDWEPDNDKIFQYLFDTHSVSCIDDLDSSWIEDAVLAIADKEGKKL
jgi:hypothetical protein